MKTIEMELLLMNHEQFEKNIVLNTITASHKLMRFETDMLSITKSGYAHGFEIKVSLSDLRNDKKKKHWMAIQENEKAAIEKYFHKLKYFSYFIPDELVDYTIDQVPDFCGIYVASKDFVYVKRHPKKLTNYKLTNDEMLKFAHLGCMRIYNLKKKLLKHENTI